MDRLISLEPSNLVAIRIEQGQKCYGELTLRNVMYTMPVAFRLLPINRIRYTIRPQSGIISPLTSVKVEIIYNLPSNTNLPDSYPYSDDAFQLHSVVVPSATIKDSSTSFDSIPNDWFTNKRKQVFIDSGLKVMFVGSSILAELVTKGSMDEIREVLEKSNTKWKPADSVDVDGQTLLHLAITQGRADLVQLLLEFEPNIEAKSRAGTSPLEAATASGEALIVELLLARKACTERSESTTWGPIHLAASGGHLEVLKLLLLKGANVDALTKDGNTALHLAVQEKRRDCVRQLLAVGASTDIRNSVDMDTPLHISAGLGDEHMVKILLQKGANKDVRNRQGKTAYDVAAEFSHTRLFDGLKLGDSLCIASRKGEVRKIQRLYENGAALNGRDQNGMTSLHRASFKGKIEAVRTLIEKGIDVNARDEDGYSALHCAVESGQADVVEFLVKKGADVDGRTNKGVTAMQIAELLQYSGITRILVNVRGYKNVETKEISNLPPMHTYGSLKKNKKTEIVETKKKSFRRARVLGSSFDRGSPVLVL